MSPEIRITQEHPGTIKSHEYLWRNPEDYDDYGLVEVKRETITVTEISVPDITGTYETELGGITVDMKHVDQVQGQRIIIDSELIGGIHTIPISETDGRGALQLEKGKRLEVTVEEAIQPDSGSSWTGNPI